MAARRRIHVPTFRPVAPAAHQRGSPDRERDQVVDLVVVPDDRLLLSVEEAARRLGIGRSLLYELIAHGRIETVRVGRLRRIPPDALDAYVASLRVPSSEKARPHAVASEPTG